MTTVVMVWMLLHGVRNTDQYSVVRYMIQGVYVAVLLWYLARTGPSISQLPNIQSLMFPRSRYGRFIPALGIALMLAFSALSDQGVSVLMLLLIIGTVWILVAWRREIKLPMVVQGVAVAIIALMGGIPFLKNGLLSESDFIILLVLVPPMFIAGGLLFKRTRLGGIHLFAKRYGKALKSFLWGCLLFVPLGLINAVSGSPSMEITWVLDWWMPLSLPLFSGIVEETWFRLLLVSLCYLLLQPAFRKRPQLAIISAVIFSAITFGLGHDRTWNRFLTTGLLYGLPMAVIFVRREWEHAVGAHYMINMIPWIMVYLEN